MDFINNGTDQSIIDYIEKSLVARKVPRKAYVRDGKMVSAGMTTVMINPDKPKNVLLIKKYPCRH